MAAAVIILCMLSGSEAVGDINELVVDLLWVAPCCCILILLVPERSDPQILYLIGLCGPVVRLCSGLDSLL